MHAYISSAVWSITRPALFILGYEDGSIEIWNLLHSLYEPFLIHYVSATSITAMSMQSLTGNSCLKHNEVAIVNYCNFIKYNLRIGDKKLTIGK